MARDRWIRTDEWFVRLEWKSPKHGFAQNLAQTDSTGPIEYNFAKSPTLQVPEDWNTATRVADVYEGPLWYEKDFAYHKTPGKRVFLHIGAANYRSYLWVNGHAICEHEGGFTGFDREITPALRDGNNFSVIAVDSTRLADGVPTLKTDWGELWRPDPRGLARRSSRPLHR